MTLLEKMRGVKTIGDGYPIYESAEISIREFDANDVSPTSKYVLRGKLVSLNRLRKRFDWTQLNEVQEVEGHRIAPPVVENDGVVDCIVDGLHRFTIGKIKKKRIRAVYIKGSNGSGRPIIGKPIRWEDVAIRRKKPETAEECRDMRVLDTADGIRRCYRDFSFMGSDGRRPRKGQDG